MAYHYLVLVKQVPDPKRVTGQAMTDEGVVDREALPPIFNPEDLNALEAALALRDKFGGKVTVLTMGPPMAAEVLREALYRGADAVALVTDKRFARADTLATSYTLCQAIRKVGQFDLVFCGRQAIDGDTAQVGPQTAEKLNLPQITYVTEIVRLENDTIVAKREIEGGYEIVASPLPALLTITAAANIPRPPNAKRLLQFKKARTPTELWEELYRAARKQKRNISQADLEQTYAQQLQTWEERGLLIPEWDLEDLNADPDRCGIRGSPTLVSKIERVVLTPTQFQAIEPTEEGIRHLLRDLRAQHVLE